MAEYCLECWNKVNNSKYKPYEYVFSKELELCEGCNKYKNIIEHKSKFTLLNKVIYKLKTKKSIH